MTVTEEAVTPDFYVYDSRPVSRVELSDNELELAWPDGTIGTFNGTWLRENSVGHGIDPVTREGIASPTDVLGHRMIDAGLESGGDTVVVGWEDGLVHGYSAGWLHSVADQRQGVMAGLPRQEPWVTVGAPPQFPGVRLVDLPTQRWPPPGDGSALATLLESLLRHGVVRLVDGPVGLDDLESMATELGPLVETNFGRVWDVVTKVEPDSTAYTDRALIPHTDLPTRERPPGFQVLHCIENDCAGGLSQMADGLAIVDYLRVFEPEHHDALTTLRWIFMSKGRSIDHRWSAPVVEPDAGDGTIIIRGFSPTRAFPDMPVGEVDRSYAAIARLHQLGADPSFQIESRFRAGDAVIFDNRRILHARSAFDGSHGTRHLRGCYLATDDVRSTARVLTRTRSAAESSA